MNIILEKRKSILEENNTGQTQLRKALESVPKSTIQLYLPQEFHGDLDFSILKELGLGRVNTIFLGKGEITSITNLPEGIWNLTCEDNYLFDLEDLPRSLRTLSIPQNYVKNLDFTRLENLWRLNISNNEFEVLERLPSKLQEIRCDSNKITRLDLEGVENLTLLHANHNKILLVLHLPAGIQDLQLENNAYAIQFRNSEEEGISKLNRGEQEEPEEKVRKNYLDALKRYFKLKKDYEDKLHKLRRALFEKTEGSVSKKRATALSVQPRCIKCNQVGGTVFSKKNNRYKAVCGNTTSPCSLHIEIFTGAIAPISYLLDIYQEETMDMKDMIIQQKLDSLLNYIPEEKSVKLFKKALESYNANSKTYDDLMKEYTECYFNPAKKEEAKKKQETIFYAKEKVHALLEQYKASKNKDVLEKAVRVQVEELLPATVELRRLRNEVNVMLEHKSQTAPSKYELYQYPCNIEELDHCTGEPPRVIHFSSLN
jgi:transcription elongation factor Elf1